MVPHGHVSAISTDNHLGKTASTVKFVFSKGREGGRKGGREEGREVGR